jgi:hypothetical protein
MSNVFVSKLIMKAPPQQFFFGKTPGMPVWGPYTGLLYSEYISGPALVGGNSIGRQPITYRFSYGRS